MSEGQEIGGARITLVNGSTMVRTIDITTVGHKRIISFPAAEVSGISIQITDAKGKPSLSEVETYLIDPALVEKDG